MPTQSIIVYRDPMEQAMWEDQYRFDWKSSDGQKVSSGFLPWLGYFENLENVYVETVQVGQFKRRTF